MMRRLVPAASLLCALAGAGTGALAQPLVAPPPLPAPATATSPAPRPDAAAAANKPDAAAPDELPDLPPARKPAPETRIEQKRVGNRVAEVIVTPAGSTRSYTIVNREGQRPANVQDLSSGLSTPRFFKFEF
jgi:hypothetical protein